MKVIIFYHAPLEAANLADFHYKESIEIGVSLAFSI